MSVTPTRGTRGPSRTTPASTKPISYEEASLRFAPALALIAAGSLDRELHRELPFEAVDTLDELGFGALRVPTEFGGAGASVETLIRIVIDVAEADSNVAQLYRSHLGFVESLHFQRPARRDHWYPRVVAGETVGNASTERTGNALGSLNTTLRHHGGAWELSGTKFYTTGTIFSDHTRVSAARADGPGRRFAVVPTDAPGVSIKDDWDGFGQRLTGTGTTTFDRVKVAPEGIFERTEGSPEAVHEAAFFQLVLLAVLAGIARAARRDAVAAVAGRKRSFNTGSGVPFREDSLIQEGVGRLSAKAFGAEAAVLAAARALDEGLAALALAGADEHDFQGQPPYELILGEIAVEQAQVLVPELALGAAQQLFETAGASATSTTKALDRHWRNAQTIATHNPLCFRARSIGDFHLNGTLPEGLTSIGDVISATRR